MAEIVGAVFDFDGTLMDTEPAIMASYEHVFEVYAKPEEFTPERRIAVLGPALDKMMAEFFPDRDPWECVEEYRRFQREHARNLIHPMNGAMEMLAKLSAMGIPCAVVCAPGLMPFPSGRRTAAISDGKSLSTRRFP